MERRFAGKICPFCKTAFKDDDVIVICSVCDMPHHLACWQENNGCTTFGCTGTIKETIGTVRVEESRDSSGLQTAAPRPEVPAQAPAGRFEVLYEDEPCTIRQGIPVLVERVSLTRDRQNGALTARGVFHSLADQPIIAMMADVQCTDIWGRETQAVKDIQFLDLKTQRDSTFGQTASVPIPDVATRVIDFAIKKVLLADRTLLEGGNAVSVLPKQVPLKDFFGSEELAQEYICETNEHAKYTVTACGSHWRCACGAINPAEHSSCFRCKSDKAQLLSLLNVSDIKDKLAAKKEAKRIKAERERAEREEQLRQAEERMRLAQEEQERQAREAAARKAEELKQKKAQRNKCIKRITITAAAVLTVIGLIYGIGWHMIPYIKYTAACDALEAQEFDKAYSAFEKLGDYLDSEDKTVETLYQKAVSLMEAGQYEAAATEFEKVPDYSDSAEKSVYCRNEAAYLAAAVLLEEGNYTEAAAAFEALGSYSDSAEQVKEAKYRYAEQLLNAGQYEEAHEAFTALTTYKDSWEQAKECYYLLGEALFTEKKYNDAYSYFRLINDYKDSYNLANEAKYLYAVECFETGAYREAYEAFQIVKNYKDAAERLPEAGYQYALQLSEVSNWKQAASLFKELGDYRDSAAKYQENYYQYGLRLLENKAYSAAATVFEELGGYLQSVSKLNEAKYGYVLAHKNSFDTTTYRYLNDLKAIGYKDSGEIYRSVYAWSVELKAVNINPGNDSVISSTVSKYCSYLHFTFTLRGGPPREAVTLTYRIYWPDGTVTYSDWDWEDLRRGNIFGIQWSDGIYESPSYAATGTLTIKIYNKSTGERIGEASVRIS